MLLTAAPEHNNSFVLLEAGLTAIALAAAFAWPRLGNGWFASIERTFGRLARRRGLAVASVGIATFLIRLAILPFCPVPLPFLPDDFSFMLACDTFAHGRLANPTPAMWIHFETVHVDMLPTYGSMYFPAQGLLMAAGKVLFGSPWFAILICSALMCSAICWMLQAWLPPRWALLGGILAMIRLGLFSYWINTYTGGGLITGLGGALVLGALPRLMKTARFRYGLLMGIGIILLALTRPYEGMLLCLPVLIVLGRWAVAGKNRPAPAVLLRRAAFPLLLMVAAAAWQCYYNYRAFGSPTILPYSINRTTYAMAPYYVWQSLRPEPAYRHPGMRRFYLENEVKGYEKVYPWSNFVTGTLAKVWGTFLFYAGFALMPPLFMVRRIFFDRRIRFLVIGVLVLAAGMVIEIFLIPHYLAPFTAAFYAIGLQCMRHLRLWSPEGKPVGLALLRMVVTICVLLGTLRLFAKPLHFGVSEWPATQWSTVWFGPQLYGEERAGIEVKLEALPGKQLVIVHDSGKRDPLEQWVYNAANIDASKVVWASEMDEANNLELVHYYPDRHVWSINIDTEPATVSPYPVPAQPQTASR